MPRSLLRAPAVACAWSRTAPVAIEALVTDSSWRTQPEKVQREDGTKVVVGTSKIGFWPELKEVCQVLKRKEVLTLCVLSRTLLSVESTDPISLASPHSMPIAFFSSLMGPYTATYLGLHFSVRARVLASLVTAILNVGINFALGFFLDSERFQLKTRARWAFAVISLLGLCTWIWGLVLQVEFSSQAKLVKYDWVDPGFARAVSAATTFRSSVTR